MEGAKTKMLARARHVGGLGLWVALVLATSSTLALAGRDARLIGWQGETHNTVGDDGEAQMIQAQAQADEADLHESIVARKFLMDRRRRPKPSHHASTIVEAGNGKLVAAWFAGKFEGKDDVGIFVSTLEAYDSNWTRPVEVVKPSNGVPTWNPVLFRARDSGEILLFYKTGRSPQNWRGYLKRSSDDGETWSEPQSLGRGIVGPAKNKPIQLADGTILAPSSREKRNRVWSCVMEESTNGGKTWKALDSIEFNGRIIQVSARFPFFSSSSWLTLSLSVCLSL